jgi:hypothetical protein
MPVNQAAVYTQTNTAGVSVLPPAFMDNNASADDNIPVDMIPLYVQFLAQAKTFNTARI